MKTLFIERNGIMNLIETAIIEAWDTTKEFFRDLDAKDQINYGIAYEEYLQKTYKRNSKIKTIIYRFEPTELYSFYEHIKVSRKGRIINTDNINNLIREGNKLIISGATGVGKSTLLKHLFLNTITNTSFIPVLLELRRFDEKTSVEDEIYKTLCDNGFKLERKYFQYSMEEGAYVILLDGFDELNKSNLDKISNEIKSLSNKYDKNKYIISSRPFEGFLGWNDFYELTPLEMDKSQVLNLINHLSFDSSVKKKFCMELKNGLFENYRTFVSNPLLLSIMLITYNQYASIPNKVNQFFETAFTALFDSHDAGKDCYKREIMSKLSCVEFKQVFSYLCFKSYFYEQTEFSERDLNALIIETREKLNRYKFQADDLKNDLISSVCLLVKDGAKYRFTHKSFQEYFAAYYTSQLTDHEQYKVVSKWIDEKCKFWWYEETYLEMLFDLQRERVNKIIICPYLRKIKEIYIKTGFSKEFLERIYENAGFLDDNDDEAESIELCVQYSDSILAYILHLNKKLNGEVYSFKEGKVDSNDAYYDLLNFIEKNRLLCSPQCVSFDLLSQALTEKRMLEELNWIKELVEFALEILDKYDKPQNQNESLRDIIDNL